MIRNKLSYAALAFIAAMVIFSSCKKTNEAGKYIAKDAAFVLVANGENITSKLPYDEIKNGEMFKQLLQDNNINDFGRQALENPGVTGIDIKNNITVFVVKDSTGGYAAVLGNIKDAAKFKSYFTGGMKDAAATNKDNLDFLSSKKMTLGWNKDRFIAVYDLPQMNTMNSLPPMGNMDDSSYTAPVLPVRNGTSLITTLFNLKDENSLANNEKFGDLMKEKGDMHFYANAENINSGSIGMSALSMLNIGKLTEGAITTGVANFEEGKIVADMKSYFGKELSDIFKKYNGTAFNTDMVKRSPIKKVAVAAGFNYDPKGLLELLRLTGLEGFANLGAKQLGFSVDDFVKGAKGDLAVTVGDFPDSLGTGSFDPQFVFATSISEKVAFAKLVAAGTKMGGSMGADNKYGFAQNDNYFALSTTKSLADAYISATVKNDYDFVNEISGQPIGGYINLQYLISAISTKQTEDLAKQETALSLAMWDHAMFKGGNWAGGALNQHAEIILMDKKTNSLKLLNIYANKMAIIQKEKEASIKQTESNKNRGIIDTIAPKNPGTGR